MTRKDRAPNGNFLAGNRFWEMRDFCGAPRTFEGPEELWTACMGFLDWLASNPLYEAKLHNGKLKKIPKLRAPTIRGMCVFIGISSRMWAKWRNGEDPDFRPDLLPIIEAVEDVLWQFKIEGASAGLLHANIIARELGLADKADHTSSDGTMAPPSRIEIVAVKPKEQQE